MLNVFATFLLAHLIADFPLQTNTMVRLKKEGPHGILLHVTVHVIIAAVLLNDPLGNWQLLLWLSCVHWVIDWTKIVLGSESLYSFVADQVAHIFSIFIIVGIAYGLEILPEPVLVGNFLYLAIAYALLLASMVFIWVWANHQSAEVATSWPIVGWAQRSMLEFSQRAGLALVGGIVLNVFF